MSAKGMFEKLDMEKEETTEIIEYHFKYDINYPMGMYGYVVFDLLLKTYHTNIVDCSEEMKKAINKQIEELGWNNAKI